MTSFAADWAAWREVREAGLRRPHGWLAITAIHWLNEQPQRFDDVPGTWTAHEGGALLVLDEGELILLDGQPMDPGDHMLGPLDEVGLTLSFGDAVAEVADRGGTPIVRPRHPDAPNLRSYLETPCYQPDPGWVAPARFEPYAGGAAQREDDLAGEVVFELGRAHHRLAAWQEEDGSLWVLLRDGTSGRTTYDACRQLLLPAPGADGRVLVDFNRVYNMPCAYTEFATCPVPPPGNTLPFPLEAGERTPIFDR